LNAGIDIFRIFARFEFDNLNRDFDGQKRQEPRNAVRIRMVVGNNKNGRIFMLGNMGVQKFIAVFAEMNKVAVGWNGLHGFNFG
jgi:hypothetical protein